MAINIEIVAGEVIVEFVDDGPGVDERLEQTLAPLLDAGFRQFTFNLEALEVVSSAVLGDIARAYTVIKRRGGNVRIGPMHWRVERELRLSKIVRLFERGDDLLTDSFNRSSRDAYRRALLAASGLMLLTIIIITIWMVARF